MKKDDFIRYQHMFLAAKDALQFVKGKGRIDLETDRLLAYGIVKALEIIGEAASKISIESRNKYPNILWQDIIGMRNRLIHVYFSIDSNQVWDTVTGDIPELLDQLEGILTDYTKDLDV